MLGKIKKTSKNTLRASNNAIASDRRPKADPNGAKPDGTLQDQRPHRPKASLGRDLTAAAEEVGPNFHPVTRNSEQTRNISGRETTPVPGERVRKQRQNTPDRACPNPPMTQSYARPNWSKFIASTRDFGRTRE